MRLKAGDKVDRYTLVSVAGAGGQGTVWKAVDALEPQLPKALKLLPLEGADRSDAERIRREARSLAKLSHPTLVRCHALVEDVNMGCLAVVLDWIDGESLLELASSPRLTKDLREAVLRHVASALAYLHDEGVVHRDLKLSNVVVTREFWNDPSDAAHVKLVDFGIAVPVGNPEPLTQLGTAIGTLTYMAPELVASTYFDAPSAAPTVDVFAFGVMGWYLLSGRYPTGEFDATREGLARIYREAAEGRLPWPASALEHKWEVVLRQCLALEADKRPTTARLVFDLLFSRTGLVRPAGDVTEPPTTPLNRSAGGSAVANAPTGPVGPHEEAPTFARRGPEDPTLASPSPADAPAPRKRKALPKTYDATVPQAPAPRPRKWRGWVTHTPRSSVEGLPAKQGRTVLVALIVCLLAAGLTALVLALLR